MFMATLESKTPGCPAPFENELQLSNTIYWQQHTTHSNLSYFNSSYCELINRYITSTCFSPQWTSKMIDHTGHWKCFVSLLHINTSGVLWITSNARERCTPSPPPSSNQPRATKRALTTPHANASWASRRHAPFLLQDPPTPL